MNLKFAFIKKILKILDTYNFKICKVKDAAKIMILIIAVIFELKDYKMFPDICQNWKLIIDLWINNKYNKNEKFIILIYFNFIN